MNTAKRVFLELHRFVQVGIFGCIVLIAYMFVFTLGLFTAPVDTDRPVERLIKFSTNAPLFCAMVPVAVCCVIGGISTAKTVARNHDCRSARIGLVLSIASPVVVVLVFVVCLGILLTSTL